MPDSDHVTQTVCDAKHKYSVWQAIGFGAALCASIALSSHAVTLSWQASYGVEKIQAVMSERSKAADVQAETVKAQLDMLNIKLDRLSEEVRASLHDQSK